MKHNLPLALIAAFCATFGPNLTGDASAGSPMRTAAAQIAAPLKDHPDAHGVVDRGETVRRVRACKKRRFYNPGVFLDGGLEHLDRNYGGMNYGRCVEPPSHEPAPRRSHRLSCRNVRELLRQRGYRRIRAHDCRGNIYNFDAYLGSRRFKLRVRSKNGTIKSRAGI